MMISSKDGGDTWSEPTSSTMLDPKSREALVLGQDASNQPVGHYASSDLVPGKGTFRTHLTLFGSRDQGKTRKELRRIHFGEWAYPTVVPLGPNCCGIGFRRDSTNPRSQQRTLCCRRRASGQVLWGKWLRAGEGFYEVGGPSWSSNKSGRFFLVRASACSRFH